MLLCPCDGSAPSPSPAVTRRLRSCTRSCATARSAACRPRSWDSASTSSQRPRGPWGDSPLRPSTRSVPSRRSVAPPCCCLEHARSSLPPAPCLALSSLMLVAVPLPVRTQRTLTHPARVRLHYGHPDLFNKVPAFMLASSSPWDQAVHSSAICFAQTAAAALTQSSACLTPPCSQRLRPCSCSR